MAYRSPPLSSPSHSDQGLSPLDDLNVTATTAATSTSPTSPHPSYLASSSNKSSSSSPSPATNPMLPSLSSADPSADSPTSSKTTPNRVPLDLPRTQVASKGGCWTCRLRRKKCDEQRQGDSCHTCVRLKIKCLGWGPKRPDWMRDKQAVEAYKADIKAQLTRAGLIRGQPRTTPMTSQQQQASSSSSSTTASTSGAHRNHPHQGHAQRNNRRSPRANLMPYHDPSSSHSHSHSHPSSPSSSSLGFTSSYPHPNPFAPLDTAGELGIGMLGIHVGGTTGVGMGSSLHLQSQHQHQHHSQSLYPPTHSPSSRALGLGLGLGSPMDGFGGGLGLGMGGYSPTQYGIPGMPGSSNSIFGGLNHNHNNGSSNNNNSSHSHSPNPSASTSLPLPSSSSISTSAGSSTSTLTSGTQSNSHSNTPPHTLTPHQPQSRPSSDFMDRNFFDFSGAGSASGSSSTLHPILTGTPSINLPSLPESADFGTLVDDTSSHSPFAFDHTTATTNASNALNPNTDTSSTDAAGGSASNASTTTTTQLQQDLVMYYFENVRKVQYIFAGNSVTNVTYSLILQEPRGAVTNAVCALASLHHTGMRVAQGLESPDPNPEYSTARYFHDEAYLQLVNAKAIKGKYDAGDAIAALHLVSFSLFSGGATAWRQVLSVAYEWVAQSSGLLGSGDIDVQSKLVAMRSIEQVIVKTTMWFDVFSSISLMQPPKFFGLWKRLLAPTFWPGAGLSGDDLTNLAASPVHMEALMGCPDDAVLAIAEISALAHWKANEVRHGKLSLRELLRRGDGIEQALRANHGADIFSSPGSPLHPNLAQQNATGNGATADGDHQGTGSHSTDDMRRVVANIFREAALLYLQTVVNGCNPGVPEVAHSVEMIVQHFQQLPRSILDRSLVFPICIAGCMTDSSPQRDFLKGRLQAQDESWGNVMSTRALMESVWRKRDVSTGVGHSNNNRAIAVDWRESLLENSVLLLV